MSNYEMETSQMNSVTSDLFKLYISLGTAQISVKGRAWLLNDGSDASAAIKRRLEKLASKIGDEAANVNQLYYYNKKVVSETKEAELGAVMDMKGYTESIQQVLKTVCGALGDIEDVADGYVRLIDQVKKAYNEVTDKIMEKTSVEGSVKREATYSSGSYAYTDGYTYADGEYKAGYAEADASFWGGIFTKDENGNLTLAPGFQAAAGAMAVAFMANGKLGIGDNLLGAGLTGEVILGKVAAQVGASCGLFDKDGNINPNIGADISLEAILAEIKGTAGISILGIDLNATATGNIGAGAHATAEANTHHVVVDIGASLGLGVSLELEIDYSDAIDTIRDTSYGLYEMEQNAFESVKGFFKKLF